MEARNIGKSVLENIAKGAKLAGRAAEGVANHLSNYRLIYLPVAFTVGATALGAAAGNMQDIATQNAEYANTASGALLGFFGGLVYSYGATAALTMEVDD